VGGNEKVAEISAFDQFGKKELRSQRVAAVGRSVFQDPLFKRKLPSLRVGEKRKGQASPVSATDSMHLTEDGRAEGVGGKYDRIGPRRLGRPLLERSKGTGEICNFRGVKRKQGNNLKESEPWVEHPSGLLGGFGDRGGYSELHRWVFEILRGGTVGVAVEGTNGRDC